MEQSKAKLKAELLAPAGSFATLKAVACAGADAVYGAGEQFGARAYAGNFTAEELLSAIDYLHIHGKRFYLAVNTMLKEPELQGMLYNYILPLYTQGLDGVIIQDLGVLHFLRNQFPELPIHASTQMNLTGSNGARLLKEFGASRIVAARELSLPELARIHRETAIEIEAFIHGALCYCYSGQCLMSSMLGGRSGNRGRCAQPCRLPYRTVTGRDGRSVQAKMSRDAHLLSPKDLCAIELLPQILKSGVYSLKIEGRMKQLEYAAGVTGIYREYLDRCLYHPLEPYQVAKEDLKRLLELGNRSGYTAGYYRQHNGPQMMAMEKSAHTSGEGALQKEIHERFANGVCPEKIKGILRLSKEIPSVFMVEWKGIWVSAEGAVPQAAKNRPLSRETITEKLTKTGNSQFVFEELTIEMEEDLFLTVGELNRLRRDALEKLYQQALLQYRRKPPAEESAHRRESAAESVSRRESAAESASRREPAEESASRREPAAEVREQPYLAVAVQTEEQLEAALNWRYADRIYLEEAMVARKDAIKNWKSLADRIHRTGKKLFYVMPAVLREEAADWHQKYLPALCEAGVDGFVTGSYEGLGLLHSAMGSSEEPGLLHSAMGSGEEPGLLEDTVQVVADSSLYVWNSFGRRLLAQAGVSQITLPVELREQELSNRGYRGGELLLYGYLPLMISAQCVRMNTGRCVKASGTLEIRDRYGKRFPVQNKCRDCYNVIYNSSPLWLFHQRERIRKLQADGYRISFTIEPEQEVRKIFSHYEQAFVKEKPLDKSCYPADYTNGHLKRGVE